LTAAVLQPGLNLWSRAPVPLDPGGGGPAHHLGHHRPLRPRPRL